MTRQINISNPEQLPSILDIIHDCRFDKEKIIFAPEISTLKIEFYREALEKKRILKNYFIFKKVFVPITVWYLKILNVENYQIQEGPQAGPGSDDFFNVLTYDEKQNQLWISTVISKGIIIRVRKLELSLEETEKVIEEKTALQCLLK